MQAFAYRKESRIKTDWILTANTLVLFRVNEIEQQKIRLQNQRLKEEISKVKHNLQYIKAQYAVRLKLDQLIWQII